MLCSVDAVPRQHCPPGSTLSISHEDSCFNREDEIKRQIVVACLFLAPTNITHHKKRVYPFFPLFFVPLTLNMTKLFILAAMN